jgi:tetratricopeptide (TPR) repeat protein
MKQTALLLLASFACAAFIHVKVSRNQVDTYKAVQDVNTYKRRYAVGCRPDLSTIDFTDPATAIPLLQGWGTYRMPVTSKNDSAAVYFQQGINMYYGFHIIEALASFEKALTFDTGFAMGYWGKALAYGPNINDMGYAASPDALTAIAKAKEFSKTCTAVEKELIDAMQVRYSSDTSQTREALNQRYADAMKQVHKDFPKSADAAALYADALMVQHPWDLYDRHYNPKPWTPEIVRVLEGLVKAFPDNPGASHYYIHAIEGSKHPEKGLEVANRLGEYMPGVAHLVHMPSHIYIRSGHYKKGVASNVAAVKGYQDYLSQYPLVSSGAYIYLMHNLHMKAACAAMDARYADAIAFAGETRNSVDSASLNAGGYFGMYSQYLYMTPLFTQVRFGKWNALINSPDFPQALVYARAMQHFGRGMAYARTRQVDKSAGELERMRDSVNSTLLLDHPPAFNPGLAAVEVAESILQGVIAEEQNQLSQAVAFFKQAVDKEEGMLYNEPRDWLLPARQYLGHTLLKAKQYGEAEKIYREDLTVNPMNAWSLTGLAQALKKQGKVKEGAAVQKQAIQALEVNEAGVTASVF